MALTFTLSLQWDDTHDVWTIVSSQFGEAAGDNTGVTSIHSLNLAMSQVLKSVQALDIELPAAAINIVPGPVVGNK